MPQSSGQPNPSQTFTVPLPSQGIAVDNLAITFLADSDGDGLLDADDPDDDNDGFSDADELVFGTNPLDAGSRFAMTFSNPAPTPGTVRLSFPTVAGRSYTVEGSADLAVWQDLAGCTGTGTPKTADLPVSPMEAKWFYRIRVTLP